MFFQFFRNVRRIVVIAGFTIGAPIFYSKRLIEPSSNGGQHDEHEHEQHRQWRLTSHERFTNSIISSAHCDDSNSKERHDLILLISRLLYPTFSWTQRFYYTFGQMNLHICLAQLAAISENSQMRSSLCENILVTNLFDHLVQISSLNLTDNEQIHLVKFISNMSQFHQMQPNLSSLISKVEQWSKCLNNAQLSLYSYKILVNYYLMKNNSCQIFRESVYPLAGCLPPSFLNNEDGDDLKEFDIVFVNGMRGSVFHTWRQCDHENMNGTNSACWPRDWLPKVFPNSRIIAVDVFLRPFLPRKSLEEISHNLWQQLRDAGVGSRPIIWISHSIGGLLVKFILRIEDGSCIVEGMKSPLDCTRGVLFLSTPHWGKKGVYLGELKRDSPLLLDLHSWFIGKTRERKIRTAHLVEATPTPVFSYYSHRFVEFDDRDSEFDEALLTEEKDHIYICKPSDDSDPLYLRILSFIDASIRNNFADEDTNISSSNSATANNNNSSPSSSSSSLSSSSFSSSSSSSSAH